MSAPGDGTTPALGVRAARGAAALALASATGQAMALGTSLVLARILGPADFGLVALANLLLAFVGPLHDSGLATAFVAKGERPREYAATLAWGATVSGILAAALVALAAPAVAVAFANPALVPVTRALAITFAFRGLAAAPLAVLTRELAFGRRALALVVAAAAESTVSITAALHGAGAWALVYGQIGSACASAAVAWLVAPWRPRGRFSGSHLWEMSHYSRHVVLGNSLGFLGSYLDNIVVGRALGTGALGVYGAAFRWGRLPAFALSMIVSPVAFPSYVSVRDDPARFRRAYVRLLRTITTLAFPAEVGLILVAGRLVETLYPPAWFGMVVPLQIFAVFGLVNAVVGMTGDVFKAANRPGWIAAIGGIHLPALALLLWLWVGSGPTGAALALTVASLASGSVAVPLALRVLELPGLTFLSALAPQALATAIMSLAVVLTSHALPPPPSVFALAAVCLVGAATYAVTLALVDTAWLAELKDTLTQTLGRKGTSPPMPRAAA